MNTHKNTRQIAIYLHMQLHRKCSSSIITDSCNYKYKTVQMLARYHMQLQERRIQSLSYFLVGVYPQIPQHQQTLGVVCYTYSYVCIPLTMQSLPFHTVCCCLVSSYASTFLHHEVVKIIKYLASYVVAQQWSHTVFSFWFLNQQLDIVAWISTCAWLPYNNKLNRELLIVLFQLKVDHGVS